MSQRSLKLCTFCESDCKRSYMSLGHPRLNCLRSYIYEIGIPFDILRKSPGYVCYRCVSIMEKRHRLELEYANRHSYLDVMRAKSRRSQQNTVQSDIVPKTRLCFNVPQLTATTGVTVFSGDPRQTDQADIKGTSSEEKQANVPDTAKIIYLLNEYTLLYIGCHMDRWMKLRKDGCFKTNEAVARYLLDFYDMCVNSVGDTRYQVQNEGIFPLINIGRELSRWLYFKRQRRLKTHEDVAKFLLDVCGVVLPDLSSSATESADEVPYHDLDDEPIYNPDSSLDQHMYADTDESIQRNYRDAMRDFSFSSTTSDVELVIPKTEPECYIDTDEPEHPENSDSCAATLSGDDIREMMSRKMADSEMNQDNIDGAPARENLLLSLICEAVADEPYQDTSELMQDSDSTNQEADLVPTNSSLLEDESSLSSESDDDSIAEFCQSSSTDSDTRELLQQNSLRPRRQAAIQSLKRTKRLVKICNKESARTSYKKKHYSDDEDFEPETSPAGQLPGEAVSDNSDEEDGNDICDPQGDAEDTKDTSCIKSEEQKPKKKKRKKKKGANNTDNEENSVQERLDDGKLKCNQCDYECTNLTLLHKHMLYKHNTAPKHGTLICSICGKVFTKRMYLKRHVLKRHDGAPDMKMSCEECDKTFPWQEYLDHWRDHLAQCEGEHVCEVCGSRFVESQQLNQHVRGHFLREERNKDKTKLTCPREGCRRVLIGQFAFKKHLRRVHDKRQVHKCPHEGCEKNFSLRGSLKVHMLQHTGTHPFSCQFCDYSAKQKVCLKLHMKTHHKDIIFTV